MSGVGGDAISDGVKITPEGNSWGTHPTCEGVCLCVEGMIMVYFRCRVHL